MINTLLLCFILGTNTLGALQQNENTFFVVSDELREKQILAIEESEDGRLWVATSEGVSRYADGVWVALNADSGLIDNKVIDLEAASDGSLWFGTTKGVSRYQNGAWRNFTSADGLVHNSVTAILESKSHVLWFGTENGISRLKNGIWDTFTVANGLANNYVESIIESIDGVLWVGTPTGLNRFFDGHWETYTVSNNLAADHILAMANTQEDGLWFGTSAGLARFRNSIFETDYSFGTDSVFSILESGDEDLWVGTNQGLKRLRHKKWTTFTEENGLPGPHVQAIFETSEEAIWIGTKDGLVGFQDIWLSFAEDSLNFLDNFVLTILDSKDDSIWVATSGGVHIFYEDTSTTLRTENGLIENAVRALAKSEDGMIWFGTQKGVNTLRNGVWDTLTVLQDSLVSDTVNAIKESFDGAMWFGTARGISRLEKGNWCSFTKETEPGLRADYISAIENADDGGLWFATYGGGISLFQNGSWTAFDPSNSIVPDTVYAVESGLDDALWFGTDNGAIRYSHGDWTQITVADGRAGNIVFAIEASRDSALWFGTMDGGVSRYQDNVWTTFRSYQMGLIGNQVRSIAEAPEGTMWLGTTDGLSRLRPDTTPPITYITQSPSEVTGTPTPLFVFSGRDFRTQQDRLLYSYTIVDTSKSLTASDWQPFTSATAFQPPPLENGTYRFYVKDRDTWRNIDQTPAMRLFTVDITPPTVTFNSHKAGDAVADEVVLVGNALDTSPIQDFRSYQLKYGFGSTADNVAGWHTDRFSPYDTTRQVRNDTLAIWHTAGLPNGIYTVWLHAVDTLDHTSDIYLPLEVVKSLTDINPRDGTTLNIDTDQIQLYIPPNALQQEETLVIKETEPNKLNPLNTSEITYTNLSFAIKPISILLSKPGTMTIGYPDLAALSIDEAKLSVYRSPDGQTDWERLGGSVNTNEKTITTSFIRLGVFALYEDLTEDTESGISNISIQPRVFSATGNSLRNKADISFDLGKASSVNIRVYNTAGRLIAVLTEGEQMNWGGNLISWNGQDSGGRSCPSGLYVVAIETDDKMQTKTVVVMNR